MGLGCSSDKTRGVHLCDAFEDRRWKDSTQSRIFQFTSSWAFACGLLSLPPSFCCHQGRRKKGRSLGPRGIYVSTPQQFTLLPLLWFLHTTPSPAASRQRKPPRIYKACTGATCEGGRKREPPLSPHWPGLRMKHTTLY